MPPPLFPLLLTVLTLNQPANAFNANFNANAFQKQRKHPTTKLSATWSNGQAIKEYQDFLATGKSEIEILPDVNSVIVSSTDDYPLVSAFIKLGQGNSKKDIIIRPNEDLPTEVNGESSFPIYIAVPPHHLCMILDNLPESWQTKFDDFVFFSGGMAGVVETMLRERGMCREAITQVDVHGFTIPLPGQGYAPQDLSHKFGIDNQGRDKITGESSSCGKWAGAVQERLINNGIRCQTGFYRDWRRWMWEMAAYDAVFSLVGAVRDDPITHKDVALYYGNEASDMLWQISNNLRGYLAVTLIYGFEDRVFEYAERNGEDWQCMVNGDNYSYQFGLDTFEASEMVCNYLCLAQKKGRFGPDLQLKPSVLVFERDLNPKTLKGNFRCDGAV